MPSEPTADSGAMSLGRFRRITADIPDHAELHAYLHSGDATVQAEWVEGGHIMNPVVMRMPFKIWAGVRVAEPEWAEFQHPHKGSVEGESHG
jgi:hypothetical protein